MGNSRGVAYNQALITALFCDMLSIEEYVIKYFNFLILLFFIGLSGGCASPSDPNTVECYLIKKICYRGNHPDRFATRERFGVEGVIVIDQGHNRSR